MRKIPFPYLGLFVLAFALTVFAQSDHTIGVDSEQTGADIDPDALKPADFPYMLRGYCMAGSGKRDWKALGGFWKSDNLPKNARRDLGYVRDEVYLLAKPDQLTDFRGHTGMTVLLINGTNRRQAFNASDSRISIVQEAKDEDGAWKPIEYLPSSWCGNSYHRVFLGRDQYWAFAAPKYEGSMPTTLRFSLRMAGRDEPIVSNEFEGSVNPEQFKEKQGHTPTNIMDPYDE